MELTSQPGDETTGMTEGTLNTSGAKREYAQLLHLPHAHIESAQGDS